MSKTHLWQEEMTEAEGSITISITIENHQKTRTRLWYRLPYECRELVTNSCDPFVVATILMAMNQSTDLIVHGEVSPSLLQNLTEFQAAWNSWLPNNYSLINIIADVEKEQINNQSSDQVIAAFSGGVDSCFTMFRHRTGSCGRWQRNLTAGLMVHGFDIPLSQKEIFDSTAQRSKIMLSSLGVELIPLATNFRQVIKVKWTDTFATALGSCVRLLQRGFQASLIPSSFPYNALSFPYGSNPVTDNLLSSNTFKIIHDGAAFSRLDKIREIVNWPEALEHIRVCWQGSQKDRNCCCCEKCVRTILNFRILGIDLPPCFEQDVTDNQILRLQVEAGGQLDALERTLKAAKKAGISKSWVNATEICIKRSQIENTLKNNLSPTLKKRLVQLRTLISKKEFIDIR
ncbi:hypothetical protein H6G54_22570 [Anabaena cylindrica FACHB-243]|uniref:Uncharacterized protein n=1 Tax=Anabaena cylindrica (strain ATCC 27899 / PCC 7122) TaxID=272123 RepID=K9Z8U7_ANACC|nr:MULTISPECIES: hypothetical protein [Anabaena]AFZ55623.1 hypothetical protein Anacy_0008 [Anabaena cylindrica PCC 7122]MBD2420437.1 hypothetical protein [Anabaena cylindrica FACHB-243]MBY5281835.1 hypothetical protein [Anabaena sp. CCAP 1446/1C]MBY5310056.1 hypothetical protein [Anabaena sp. CCAP 1446/1C]MCM2406937.1 hypothetical protein [Anabaena sp. CCAP 1446/1C]